jgi:hypothetical protein
MLKTVGGRTVTSTISVGALLLSVALYTRAGATGAAKTVNAPVARQSTPPTRRPPAPPPARPANRASATPTVDFDKQVKPILEANCIECHSADKRKGGLSLAAYTDILDGGRSGAVVRPGHSATSILLARIQGDLGDRMPLDTVPLADTEIATLRQWVDQGARRTPSSPPAPAPWEAPLALTAPAVPAAVWARWDQPTDRLVAAYLTKARVPQPRLIADPAFARRAYLDIWGLLPSPERLQAFLADPAPDKRDRLVATLLGDNTKYAEHWISFWNDLLRNDDGQTYFSDADGGGRQSITPYLLPALTNNTPYKDVLAKLINPTQPGDPAGFIIGVNWRGETSAAVTPWMQASQNTAQAFLGVNFKCNACHDSFVSKWKLKDAYGLAAYFSPEAKLQLYRCDIAKDEYTEPSFFYPELARSTPSASLADRRATAVEIFTDPRNGRMPRTVVNRIWTRLLGHGIVANSDDMDGRPWSPELLDWLAVDFVANNYDLKHLIGTIIRSRAYQMAAVPRTAEVPARGYQFRGPEIRRISAEQFADAIGSITGEWSIVPAGRGGGNQAGGANAQQTGRGGAPLGAVGNAPAAGGRAPAPAQGASPGNAAPRGAPAPRTDSEAVTSGIYAREFRAASTLLTRALGRPIRDQVTSVRAQEATTLQALELVNGEILTSRLMRGARRMVGELAPDPRSLFNAAVAGRTVQPRQMDADISNASKLYLLVSDTGSNAPERVLPAWTNMQLIAADGTVVPLPSLTPLDGSGRRGTPTDANRLSVKNNSRLVYDIAGRGFTRLRGTLDVENDRADIGSTLNPSVRFFVFDAEPNMDRLLPPSPELPMAPAAPVMTVRATVDRIFWSALGRAPSAGERRTAEAAIADPARPGRPSPDAVADLLWAVLMKPEFQLLY